MRIKFYKRIISLLISVMMIVFSSIAVSATDNTYVHTEEEIEKIRTIAQDYLYESIDGAPLEIVVGTKPFSLKFNGYSIIYAGYNLQLEMIMVKRIGGYIYFDYSYCYPSDLGCLVINPETGDIFELEEALETGLVDEDVLFSYTGGSAGFKMYLVGDTNNDQKLSILDATEIQKAIANITQIVEIEYSNETVYDFNGDGQVNIIDSTELQKSLIS